MSDIPEPPIPEERRLTRIIPVQNYTQRMSDLGIPAAYAVEELTPEQGSAVIWGFSIERGIWYPHANSSWLVRGLLNDLALIKRVSESSRHALSRM